MTPRTRNQRLSRKKFVENKKLCHLVQQHPLLYDSAHKEHLQQKATEEAWQTVAAMWGKPVSKCKTRWRNLRAAYARSIGAYKTKRRRDLDKPYYLTKQMEFLRPHLCKEAAAAVAVNGEAVASSLAASTSRADTHSAPAGNDERVLDLFIQQMQGMNSRQKLRCCVEALIKFLQLLNDISEELTLRDSAANLQDRSTQSDDVTIKNEPQSPI